MSGNHYQDQAQQIYANLAVQQKLDLILEQIAAINTRLGYRGLRK